MSRKDRDLDPLDDAPRDDTPSDDASFDGTPIEDCPIGDTPTGGEPRDDAREALHAHFSRIVASAPPVPDAVRVALRARTRSPIGGVVPVRDGRRPRTLRAACATAAAGLLVAASMSLLLPQRDVDASPAAVIARATSEFLRLRSAALDVAVRSKILNFLDAENTFTSRYRVDVQAPDRFVVHPVDEGGGSVSAGIAGCDGTLAWTWDDAANEVEVAPVDPAAVEGLDFTRFLGFGFIRSLHESDDLEIAETTSTLEVRAGWRSFELLPLTDADDDQVFWSSARFVVDPARDLILQYSLEVSAGPISVFDLTVELAEDDAVFTPGHFRFERHVPDGAVIRHVPAGEAGGIRVGSIRIKSATHRPEPTPDDG